MGAPGHPSASWQAGASRPSRPTTTAFGAQITCWRRCMPRHMSVLPHTWSCPLSCCDLRTFGTTAKALWHDAPLLRRCSVCRHCRSGCAVDMSGMNTTEERWLYIVMCWVTAPCPLRHGICCGVPCVRPVRRGAVGRCRIAAMFVRSRCTDACGTTARARALVVFLLDPPAWHRHCDGGFARAFDAVGGIVLTVSPLQ